MGWGKAENERMAQCPFRLGWLCLPYQLSSAWFPGNLMPSGVLTTLICARVVLAIKQACQRWLYTLEPQLLFPTETLFSCSMFWFLTTGRNDSHTSVNRKAADIYLVVVVSDANSVLRLSDITTSRRPGGAEMWMEVKRIRQWWAEKVHGLRYGAHASYCGAKRPYETE